MTEMQQAHRACMDRWADAETIAELGELGALWLEGEIPSQPGYEKLCGPDPETEHLVPVLARLNRAGYFTCGSQPGITPESGCEYDHWQRAAIDGFIDGDNPDLLAEITTVAREIEGLHLIVHATPRRQLRRFDHFKSMAVTRFAGEDCTWFGACLSRRYLRFMYGETGALDALWGSWQVTVVDEVWGRDDALWSVLDEVSV